MKQILLSFILIFSSFVLPLSVDAQRKSDQNRSEWLKEMRQYKNDFIAKKLALTDEQKEKFIPLYNSMDNDIRKVQKETEQLYHQTRKNEKASELEYEKAAEAVYELKGRENEIEMKYFNDFKKILTPKQLFKLKDAERDFTRQLMKHHREKKRQ